jgi:hypothetical protein
MPAPFVRRMRVINLLSALTLRKIEDDMIEPFEVMDIHHVLNEQVSQDAIIAMLENDNLALALETGNMQPLWVESKEKPLLRKGFEQQWIQRFITTPFDPICIMLAMRAKLMLDVVDELGHSYNLLRSIGMGWIDFGEIPGELPGDPDSYIPPSIDTPIDPPYIPSPLLPGIPDYVPGPGEPGYIPPGDFVPGDPGYMPMPGDQYYIPPAMLITGQHPYESLLVEMAPYPPGWDQAIYPGYPDYVPTPGEPDYTFQPSPGAGIYGGDFGPGRKGRKGGPRGGGGPRGSAVSPMSLGFGPGSFFGGLSFNGGGGGGGINCCRCKDDPEEFVNIGYNVDEIEPGDTLDLTVEQAKQYCDGDNYEWFEVNGVGTLDAESGLAVIYTAPATGHNCPGNAEIWLMCGGEKVDSLIVKIDYEYEISFLYPDPELEISREDSQVVTVEANGTPLTWEVSGTGFFLEHEVTAGCGNVLHADETACGPATITIYDCDGNYTIGFVRCVEGQWVLKTMGCGFPGEATEIVTSLNNIAATRIQGYQKQTAVCTRTSPTGSGVHDTCEEARAVVCTDEGSCLTFELDCSVYGGGSFPNLCAPLVCTTDCIPYSGGFYVDVYNAKGVGTMMYYEWEC